MMRMLDSRIGLPLAIMVPIGLACESEWGYRSYAKSPSHYYYDNFFNESQVHHDGRGGGGWDSRSVDDHIREKYRR